MEEVVEEDDVLETEMKNNTGECSDEHRALASEAPERGLQPSAFDRFREAKRRRELQDRYGEKR